MAQHDVGEFVSCAHALLFAQCIVHVSTEVTTALFANTVTSGCSKCGTSKKGKPNCCARGGAWVGKCGFNDDPTFDHTWDEGLEVCKSEFANDAGRAESKKFEEVKFVGSSEQNVPRWTSPVSFVGVFPDSDVDRSVNCKFKFRPVEIVTIISILLAVIL